MNQTVIYLVCILKTSCAQEPPVFLVHTEAGEQHSFGKAGMQEIALVVLWAHCFIVEHDWAECLGYSDAAGLNSFPWLTSSQRQGLDYPALPADPHCQSCAMSLA